MKLSTPARSGFLLKVFLEKNLGETLDSFNNYCTHLQMATLFVESRCVGFNLVSRLALRWQRYNMSIKNWLITAILVNWKLARLFLQLNQLTWNLFSWMEVVDVSQIHRQTWSNHIISRRIFGQFREQKHGNWISSITLIFVSSSQKY